MPWSMAIDNLSREDATENEKIMADTLEKGINQMVMAMSEIAGKPKFVDGTRYKN